MCLCVVYPFVSSLRWFVVLISFSTSLFRVFSAAHDGERLKRCILCAWYIMNRNINIHLAPSIAAALAATAVRICGLEPEPCVCVANANIQQVYQNSFCTLPISISSNMIYSVIAAHRCCCHWYGGNCTAAKLFIMSPQPQCHHSHCTRVCVLSVCCVILRDADGQEKLLWRYIALCWRKWWERMHDAHWDSVFGWRWLSVWCLCANISVLAEDSRHTGDCAIERIAIHYQTNNRISCDQNDNIIKFAYVHVVWFLAFFRCCCCCFYFSMILSNEFKKFVGNKSSPEGMIISIYHEVPWNKPIFCFSFAVSLWLLTFIVCCVLWVMGKENRFISLTPIRTTFFWWKSLMKDKSRADGQFGYHAPNVSIMIYVLDDKDAGIQWRAHIHEHEIGWSWI